MKTMEAIATKPARPAPEAPPIPREAGPSPELTELLDNITRAETTERQQRELERSTRMPRGAD
jgi:hypothetical protein